MTAGWNPVVTNILAIAVTIIAGWIAGFLTAVVGEFQYRRDGERTQQQSQNLGVRIGFFAGVLPMWFVAKVL